MNDNPVTGHMRQLLKTLEVTLSAPGIPVDRYNAAYAQYRELRDAMRDAGINVPDFTPPKREPERRTASKPFTLRAQGSFTQRMNRKAGVRK